MINFDNVEQLKDDSSETPHTDIRLQISPYILYKSLTSRK